MSAPPCTICAAPAKYTCPRCATRTCSLPCSRAHKSTTGCTGERDKAAYVPMNRYGYGTMMDDYVFLEEGKRRVESWGKGIEGMKQGAVSGKCAALRGALRGLGVRVDFLPEGMERRRKNQSHYNPKTNLIQLSLEFQYPSPPPGARPTPTTPTHQMQNIPLDEHTSLAHIYTHNARKIPPHYPQPSGKSRDADTPLPPLNLVFVIPVYFPPSPTPQTSPIRNPSQPRFYPPLPASATLRSVLRGTSFLEYPSLHVFLARDWDERVRDGKVGVVPRDNGAVMEGGKTAVDGSDGSNVEGHSAAKKARIEEPVESSPVHESSAPKRATMPASTTSDKPPTSAVEPELHEAQTRDEASAEARPARTPGLLSLDYGTESEEGG